MNIIEHQGQKVVLTSSFFQSIMAQSLPDLTVTSVKLIDTISSHNLNLKYGQPNFDDFKGLYRYQVQYELAGKICEAKVFVKAHSGEKLKFFSGIIQQAFLKHDIDMVSTLPKPFEEYTVALRLNDSVKKETFINLP